jgi:hypothetical protein
MRAACHARGERVAALTRHLFIAVLDGGAAVPEDAQTTADRGGPIAVRRPRRDDGALLLGLVITLALLAGAAAIADRIAARLAQNAIAVRLETATAMTHTPQVRITGWPFLTQLFAHNLSEVAVSTTDYPAGQVTLAHVQLTLHDAWRSGFDVTAKRVSGEADVSLAELQRLVGSRATLSSSASGLRATATVGGRKVSGTATLSVHGTQLRLTPHLTTPVPVTLAPIDVTLPVLPWNVTISDAVATDTGVRLTGSATNVDLTGHPK